MSLDTTGAAGATSNPLGGAEAVESRFENLWQGGAFDSQNPKEAAQLRAERGQPEPASSTPAPATVTPTVAPADPAAQAAPEAEGPEYVNVEDYLQKSGIERESFLALPMRVKVDGKEMEVPLADIVKNFGLERHFQSKSVAFAEQQKAWETERAQAQQALQQHLGQAETLAKLAHQQLLAEYQGIDWNQLRVQDPIQWAVRNQEFNQKANAIQAHLGQVQQAQQQQQQQGQQAQAQQLQKERERMYEVRPEWRDDTQFQSARTEMTAYAQKLGFTPAEISSIFDHRYMCVLHDAARFAALQAQSPQAVKRVRAAPQQVSPGARISRDPKQVAQTQAKERFAKSRGRDQDAAAAYFEHLAT
jgi:hypothetical protein